jgi:hypothetical protein
VFNKMRGISRLAERTVSFSRTLLRGVHWLVIRKKYCVCAMTCSASLA